MSEPARSDVLGQDARDDEDGADDLDGVDNPGDHLGMSVQQDRAGCDEVARNRCDQAKWVPHGHVGFRAEDCSRVTILNRKVQHDRADWCGCHRHCRRLGLLIQQEGGRGHRD